MKKPTFEEFDHVFQFVHHELLACEHSGEMHMNCASMLNIFRVRHYPNETIVADEKKKLVELIAKYGVPK